MFHIYSGLQFVPFPENYHFCSSAHIVFLTWNSLTNQLWNVSTLENVAFTSSAGFLSLTAAAKSLQSCPTLCDPIDGSPPGSPVPGILQARVLEWVAISFSKAWKWKVKVKSLSQDSWRLQGLQPTRLLRPWGFPGKSTGVGCHRLLRFLPNNR